MTTDELELRQREMVRHAVVRLRARVMALTFGMVGGTGVLVATAWLLVRGGHDVGAHLSLLANYFPGYTVSWGGALLGFGYGALLGGVSGWALARLYNRVSDWRGAR